MSLRAGSQTGVAISFDPGDCHVAYSGVRLPPAIVDPESLRYAPRNDGWQPLKTLF